MNSHARVLIVGRDEMLLRTREMILGAYFVVQRAGRLAEAITAMRNTRFDLIVMCHSLICDESEALAFLAQQHTPRPLILAMNSTSRVLEKPWADRQLGEDAGPYALVKKCAEMLGYVLKSKARAAHV